MDFFSWIWQGYKDNYEPIAGIIGTLTALATIMVLLFTARAANATVRASKAAKSSADVSLDTLKYTQDNARREEFINHFTLLLEQHNEQLNIVKKYLDEDGQWLLTSVRDAEEHIEACDMLRGHEIISPYMRVLYHLLKHISKSFYINGDSIDDKKKYSSIVRSLIRNDVLFLVAVNASHAIDDGEDNDYAKYQKLLHEFNFFEHALFFALIKPNNQTSSEWLDDFQLAISKNISERFECILNEEEKNKKIKIPIPFIASCIFNNPLHSKTIEKINLVIEGIDSFSGTAKRNIIDGVNGNKGLKEKTTDEVVFDYFKKYKCIDKDIYQMNLSKGDGFSLDEFRNLPKINYKHIEQLIGKYSTDFESKIHYIFEDAINKKVEIINVSGSYAIYNAMKSNIEKYNRVKNYNLTSDVENEKEYWISRKADILNQRAS